MTNANFPLLDDRTMQLATPPDNTGRPKYLKIKPGKFNRIQLSTMAGVGQWINVDIIFDEWCKLLQDLIDLSNGASFVSQIDCLKNNQVAARILAGKDEDGLIYVEISQTNQPQSIRFFARSQKQYVTVRDGAPMAPNVESRRAMLSWVRRIEPIMARAYEANYMPENKDAGMRNSGYKPNGQYRGGNNGGNNQYQQQQQSWGNGNNQQAPVAQGDLQDYINLG